MHAGVASVRGFNGERLSEAAPVASRNSSHSWGGKKFPERLPRVADFAVVLLHFEGMSRADLAAGSHPFAVSKRVRFGLSTESGGSQSPSWVRFHHAAP